ncbi:glycosyltransferase [Fusobacterium ulcerans]|uniref:glycosyltransferase n=1 Tax=Fusobacterium ulcerans TaxID=861 RepID=UPI00103282D3|nr:glycosyltransferase [Fusobacterium ulcerans]
MKIVHIQMVVTSSGNAPYRLHKMLLKHNIDSKMIVQKKLVNDETVYQIKPGKIEKYIYSNMRLYLEKIYLKIFAKKDLKLPFSSWKIGIDISKHKIIQEADIIHLHWVNGGFLNINSIKKLYKLKKKIIWTCHDNGPFTGGCHVKLECENYISGCGKCRILNSRKTKDLSYKILRSKIKILKDLNKLNIICPSKWMEKNAKKSLVFKNKKIELLENVLDETIFKKIDKKLAREILNLENNKKYILFGAVDPKTEYKGYYYLKEALKTFYKKGYRKDIELIIFGSKFILDKEIPYKIINYGNINNDLELSLLYNSSDVFIGPSLEESFGQTFNESIFCGTPAIGFKNTGVESIINHLVNGYLADYKSSEDLVKGLEYFLFKSSRVEPSEKLTSKYLIKKYIEICNEKD